MPQGKNQIQVNLPLSPTMAVLPKVPSTRASPLFYSMSRVSLLDCVCRRILWTENVSNHCLGTHNVNKGIGLRLTLLFPDSSTILFELCLPFVSKKIVLRIRMHSEKRCLRYQFKMSIFTAMIQNGEPITK